ncbi:spore germination protein [Paenibacillus wynnii]|uniref:Spore gernimation protein KA n=1 Tax=Paenibacillus wynnii TaxID=268407 RepID=A0A098MAU5_9BACL|nr:spore germination protein [Paenibacillus wynnii]KGE18657.1 spore gernimation protein KA [Paenibacillus wynnii]
MPLNWIKDALKPAKSHKLDALKKRQQANEKSLTSSLSHTLSFLKSELGTSPDFVIREFNEDSEQTSPVAVCYIQGLVDNVLLTDLIEAIITENSSQATLKLDAKEAAALFKKKLPLGNIKVVKAENELVQTMLAGSAMVIIDGVEHVLAVSISGGSRRGVEEPTSQTVVRGPKEGFTEDISLNIALLRRKLLTPHLKLESHIIGEYTQTKVILAYIDGIAPPEVVEEVNKRLRAIDTDSILESGYIEEFIQDGAFSPFPTILNTERPDTAAGALLDGQVAILVDGTPFVLIAPVTFFNFFQSSEDYYQRYDISTFLRVVRLMSFLVALLLPSLYIAITTFQQEILPTTLLISLSAQREGTPLPALMEALMMEMMFEVIREAGVRMPRVIGPAISIVGALVIGQAAVQAGLVSGAMVIVVSFTAIANFVIPYFNMASAVRLIRFTLMILGGVLGLFGIIAGIIPILSHLVALKSFGIHYMMPYAPFYKSNMKDLLLRVPWWAMKTRPSRRTASNKYRQAAHQFPESSVQKGNTNETDSQE